MRVYISVDMEGIGGINHPHPTDPADRRYPESVALMIAEANAAIEGALAAGATDVLVNDSHWSMTNLLPAELHPAARVLQGENFNVMKTASFACGCGTRLVNVPRWLPTWPADADVSMLARSTPADRATRPNARMVGLRGQITPCERHCCLVAARME